MKRRKILAAALVAASLGGAAGRLSGICGPFFDVDPDAFCPFVVEVFVLGITTGTTATTYDPAGNVTRLQMAAFLSRSVDGALTRNSRAAALNQFWTTQNTTVLGMTTVGDNPNGVRADGRDVWVANQNSGTVSRVRASDGRLLETWSGATTPFSVLVAMGQVLVTGNGSGRLYRIDPSQPAGAMTTVATVADSGLYGIDYDGSRVWTANSTGSVSIFTPSTTLPWTVTTVTAGFQFPIGAVFDGTNVWVTETALGTLLRLDSSGAILQTVSLGPGARFPVFDGTNIWVPSPGTPAVAVVRASTGAVLQMLTGNGLTFPEWAAFDGRRVLVTNPNTSRVSVWKAADMTPLGFLSTGSVSAPFGACSDGTNFFVTLSMKGVLARF